MVSSFSLMIAENYRRNAQIINPIRENQRIYLVGSARNQLRSKKQYVEMITSICMTINKHTELTLILILN